MSNNDVEHTFMSNNDLARLVGRKPHADAPRLFLQVEFEGKRYSVATLPLEAVDTVHARKRKRAARLVGMARFRYWLESAIEDSA
jgi:hypothetical protein